MRVEDELIEGLRAPSAGDRFADRFVIIGEAGVGGMGIVYRAIDESSGATVALKVLRGADATALERLSAEGEVLAQLDHPGLVRRIAEGISREGEPYLAMEWIDGKSLSARLADGALTVDQTILLGRRIADALAALHARGFLHRDVKPSNILLPDGCVARAKLADLGVARRIAVGAGDWTGAGVIVGTPGYMSPEQARGIRDLDGRTDLFALGCVLFRCLTDRGAFDGSIVLTALAKLLLLDPPRVSELRSDVPPALDELIARLLAKERGDRPACAGMVRDELQGMVEAVRLAATAGVADARSRSAGRPLAGTRLGRYLLEQPIATGGSGRLFTAWDTELWRRVTIKVLRDPGVHARQLFSEARAAAALTHPGIVAVHDVGKQDGIAFLAMEHLSGETLRARVGTRERRRPIGWLVDLARALDAAHQAGLVHGDIKPENVIVTDTGQIKLVDFGSAGVTDGAGAGSRDDTIAGTPAYVAPEKLRRERVDGRADQFAWGVIACELLVGRVPWSGDDPLSILASVLFEEPSMTGLPPRLTPVIRRTLSKWPDDRFPSMAKLLRALAFACQAATRRIFVPPANGRSPLHVWKRWACARTLSLSTTTYVKRENPMKTDRARKAKSEKMKLVKELVTKNVTNPTICCVVV